jgi:hypothetical protein
MYSELERLYGGGWGAKLNLSKPVSRYGKPGLPLQPSWRHEGKVSGIPGLKIDELNNKLR